MRYSLASLRHCEVMSDIANERDCSGGNRDVAFEHVFEVLAGAVVGLSVVAVLGNAGAVKADAGEKALVAGVAEQFRTHLPVGGRLTGATHRTRGGRGVSADLELVFEQSLHPTVVDGDE